MSVLFVLVPVALLVVLAAVIAFAWAARRGQFDDMTTPAIRAILDDGAGGAAPHDVERPRPPGVPNAPPMKYPEPEEGG